MAAGAILDRLLASRTSVGPLELVSGDAETGDVAAIKTLVDQVAGRLSDGVVLLAGASNGKGVFVAKATPGAVRAGAHAGRLVGEVAQRAGGGGGGRPEFAQAGARDPALIPEALAAVPELLRAQLAGGEG
jgi:alanyl-tRNA synthetase